MCPLRSKKMISFVHDCKVSKFYLQGLSSQAVSPRPYSWLLRCLLSVTKSGCFQFHCLICLLRSRLSGKPCGNLKTSHQVDYQLSVCGQGLLIGLWLEKDLCLTCSDSLWTLEDTLQTVCLLRTATAFTEVKSSDSSMFCGLSRGSFYVWPVLQFCVMNLVFVSGPPPCRRCLPDLGVASLGTLGPALFHPRDLSCRRGSRYYAS